MFYGGGLLKFLSISPLILVVLIIWSFYWKIRALWNAARDGRRYWFFFLIIINTLGILEILYLYVFRKKAKK